MIDWVKQLEQSAQNVIEVNNSQSWPQLKEAINDLSWHLNLLRQSRKEKARKNGPSEIQPETWLIRGFNAESGSATQVEGEPFAVAHSYEGTIVFTKQKKEGI